MDNDRLSLPTDWQHATPPQIAAEYGLACIKPLRWIESGELKARNLATDPNGRPLWRILRADWDAFLEARASRPAAPAPAPRRKRTTGTKQYV